MIAANIMCFLFLLISSVMDIKNKAVPKFFLLISLIISVFTNIIAYSSLLSLIASLIPGAIILLCAKVSRQQIGYGDGISLIITGLFLGFTRNITLLLYGLIFASVFSLIIIVFKHAGKKDTLAFLPFLTLSQIGIWILC